ncbi:MAG TPA: hypothetical protein VGL38_10835 [bacterium]|jgi:hypothetical protein
MSFRLHTFAQIIVFLALTATCSFAQLRDPEVRLPGRQTNVEGISVELRSAKRHYIEGQEILLFRHVHCDPARPLPWYTSEFRDKIIVMQNGSPVLQPPKGSRFPENNRRIVSDDTLTFFAGFTGQPSTVQQSGFRHLSPGHYTGYFEDGVTSPEFAFIVDPVPASLRADWTSFCDLKQIRQRPRMTHTPETEDSVRRVAEVFLAKRAGAAWRKEALIDALDLMTDHRREWQQSDTLLCDRILTAMASEPEIMVDILCSAVCSSIGYGLTDSGTAQVLRSFGERTGRADVVRVADHWVRQ